MRRRVLTLYAISLLCGVVLADLACERDKGVAAVFLGVWFVAITSYLGTIDEYGIFPSERRGMIVMLGIGIVVFSMQYFFYDISEERYEEDKASSVTGKVLSVSDKSDHYELIIKSELPSSLIAGRRILVRDYSGGDMEWEIGDLVSVQGELKVPDTARNPGTFNYRNYLKSKRISYVINSKSVKTVSQDETIYGRYRRFIEHKKLRYVSRFNEETGGFVMGALFGDKGLISEDVYEEFTGNGTAHILAVSGLHVGFILLLIRMVMRGRRSRFSTTVTVLILLAYCSITAWSPSTIRAVIIATIAMLSIYARRPFDLTSALSASLIITLMVCPCNIYNAGYIMSYVAMYGIAFTTTPLSHFLGDRIGPLAAIQLSLLPCICYLYHQFNPLSIIINIPIVAIASLMIPLYAVGFVVEIYASSMPGVMITMSELITSIMIKLNSLMSVNGMFIRNIASSIIFTLGLYVAAAFICSELVRVLLIRNEKRTAGILLVMIMIPVIVYASVISNSFQRYEVVFVDVGQGDAIHLRCGKANVLFDGGGQREYNVGEKILKPYFLANGAERLDMVFITHLHMDHAKGARELGEVYRIDKGMIPAFYRSSIAHDKCVYGSQGDVIRLDKNVTVEVLWPLDDGVNSTGIGIDVTSGTDTGAYTEEIDSNEINAVYKIQYEGVSILITGDLLESDEMNMIEYYSGTDKLKSDILKVGHHGSNSSTSDEWLDAVNPRIAVIQVGKNNIYGHPSGEVVDRLHARNIPVFRNDEQGAIGIDIRGNNISVNTMISD